MRNCSAPRGKQDYLKKAFQFEWMYSRIPFIHPHGTKLRLETKKLASDNQSSKKTPFNIVKH